MTAPNRPLYGRFYAAPRSPHPLPYSLVGGLRGRLRKPFGLASRLPTLLRNVRDRFGSRPPFAIARAAAVFFACYGNLRFLLKKNRKSLKINSKFKI